MILFTSVGRRVELMQLFEAELQKKDIPLFACDTSNLAPAINIPDKFFLIPAFTKRPEKYINRLLEICKENRIKLLIPLHEGEFDLLCENREEFHKVGTRLLLSSSEALKICKDKYETYKFFSSINIPVGRTYTSEKLAISQEAEISYPVIVKPRSGMGSSGVYKAKTKEEKDFFVSYSDTEIVIQEFLEGDEYTIDCLCDFSGRLLAAVPRKRLEVRNGEVSKSITINNKKIIEYVKVICDNLKLVGPINIQCFVTKDGIFFNEINPRFGGGVPLSYKAGVNYPELLWDMVLGKQTDSLLGEFEEGLYMLRYDQAFFMRYESNQE